MEKMREQNTYEKNIKKVRRDKEIKHGLKNKRRPRMEGKKIHNSVVSLKE